MIKDRHVFQTFKTRLQQCHCDGVTFSIVTRVCVVTACVVLSACALLLAPIAKPCRLVDKSDFLAWIDASMCCLESVGAEPFHGFLFVRCAVAGCPARYGESPII